MFRLTFTADGYRDVLVYFPERIKAGVVDYLRAYGSRPTDSEHEFSYVLQANTTTPLLCYIYDHRRALEYLVDEKAVYRPFQWAIC